MGCENEAFNTYKDGHSEHAGVRTLYCCRVQFGPGAQVQHVVTPFESCRITLSNLPSSMTKLDLIAIVSEFKTPLTVSLYKPTPSVLAADLEFSESAQASEAVVYFNDRQVHGFRLNARLSPPQRATESGAGMFRGRKVKLSWFAPRLSVFAHYRKHEIANREAQRLEGQLFDGYRIRASYNKTSTARRQGPGHVFTVMLRNLPLDASLRDLKSFCRASEVVVDESCDRNSLESIVRDLRLQLEEIEGFEEESLELLPLSKDTPKVTAFAQFRTPEAADTAVKLSKLSSGKLLFVQRIFSVKYSIRAEQFTRLKPDLDSLSLPENETSTNARMRFYTHDSQGNRADPVTVLVHAPEPKLLAPIKAEIDKIVQGEPLLVNGTSFWDEYLDSPDGKKFLDQLNLNKQFFVKCDPRNRTVRVLGNSGTTAQDAIIEQIRLIRARRHVLPLRQDQLRTLVTGALVSLQTEVGEAKLTLNIANRPPTLLVHGNDEDVARVRRAIDGLSLQTENYSEDVCPVCFCEVQDPIKIQCGHSYCSACLAHFLRPHDDRSYTPLRCVAEVQPDSGNLCNVDIPYSVIRQSISGTEEDRLLRDSFLSYVNAHSDEFRFCPSPDCEVLHRPDADRGSLQCPSCCIRICLTCNVEYHEGMSCLEYQDNLKGGTAAFARWREANGVKQCPRCRAEIEKDGGCNHMQCFVCKTHICWVCMRTFSESDSSGGVYSHMKREHGGFGDY